jgi:rRNA maturation endonuclease Nob1
MFIHKCDFCGKEIEEPVYVGLGFRYEHELCDDCGAPILRFLIKNKIIDKNKNKIKKT